jgi:hypothetical protein
MSFAQAEAIMALQLPFFVAHDVGRGVRPRARVALQNGVRPDEVYITNQETVEKGAPRPMNVMLKLMLALLVASLLPSPGCGKKSEAVSPPPLPPSATHNRGFTPQDFATYEPPAGQASRMPAGEDGLLETVELVVEEVESNLKTPFTGLAVRPPPPPPKLLPRGGDAAAPKEGDPRPEEATKTPFELPADMITATDLEKQTKLIAVKVKVTSKRDNPRVCVQPERFTLEPYRSGDGGTYPLLHSFRKSPALPTMYLRNGESASGWLTYRVPMASNRFKLRAEIRNPPIEVVIDAP